MPGPAREPVTCRLCQQPLLPLERRQGAVCRRAACRHRAVEEAQARARAAELQLRRAAVAPTAPLLWLQPHRARLVRVSAAERREQRAHLNALADGSAEDLPAAQDASSAPTAPDASVLPGRVCAFCAGRCCRHGAFSHAFVTRALLERWVAAHPGSTLRDAAADYAARLPERHVEASCLHHGAAGCTLPREMRSDICNRHACDALVRARQLVAEGAPEGLVVAMADRGAGVQRAAWLTDAQARALPKSRRH
jgi:hypothetical protein